MLVLSREVVTDGSHSGKDEIHVNGPAIIRIVESRGRKVKVGVEAQPSTKVLRGELVDRPDPRAA